MVSKIINVFRAISFIKNQEFVVVQDEDRFKDSLRV
jgi:hypothetical protein